MTQGKFPNGLQAAMKAANLGPTELGRLADEPKQNIDRWAKQERRLNPEDAAKLAPHLGSSVIQLLQLEQYGAVSPDRQAPTVQIPDLAIFGGLGGGGMLEVLTDESGSINDQEQLRGFWSFPDYMVAGFRNLRGIYAWEVRGDSMEPTLAGGSVVFVDMNQAQLPPEDIYAIDYGDGLMVKRLKLVPRTDRVQVISDNERYGSDELLRDEVRVYGRIVGWFQWRK